MRAWLQLAGFLVVLVQGVRPPAHPELFEKCVGEKCV